jgi:hypothetical protein
MLGSRRFASACSKTCQCGARDHIRSRTAFLPRGFHRIRHHGLLASSARKASLALARELLNVALPPEMTLRKNRLTSAGLALAAADAWSSRGSNGGASLVHRLPQERRTGRTPHNPHGQVAHTTAPRRRGRFGDDRAARNVQRMGLALDQDVTLQIDEGAPSRRPASELQRPES